MPVNIQTSDRNSQSYNTELYTRPALLQGIASDADLEKNQDYHFSWGVGGLPRPVNEV